MGYEFKSYSVLDIDNFYFDELEEAFYPPILDKDPIFAASFLTKEDMLLCYVQMREMYETLGTEECKYTLLVDSVMSFYENFIWFTKFFKKIEDILLTIEPRIQEPYEIPYEKAPKPKNKRIPVFQSPFHIVKRGKRYKTIKEKINIKSVDPIDRHRVMYIGKSLEFEDFVDGFPAWYLMHDTTVYEKYNPKTNVRIRVDFRNGEFLYFISGASDNWQILQNVPLEMDHIISALIFRD